MKREPAEIAELLLHLSFYFGSYGVSSASANYPWILAQPFFIILCLFQLGGLRNC